MSLKSEDAYYPDGGETRIRELRSTGVRSVLKGQEPGRDEMIDNLGHSLRRLRESRHFSLKVLAEQTGFSASFLSQVENGQASPSISSMERIATTLGVTLGQFFNHAEASRGSVVRHNDRPTLNLDWSLAEIESAGALDSGSQLYAFVVKMRAGGLSGKHPRPSTNDEFAFMHSGEVILTLGETDHVLVPGDSAVIPAGINRRWRNESSEPVQILIISAKAHV